MNARPFHRATLIVVLTALIATLPQLTWAAPSAPEVQPSSFSFKDTELTDVVAAYAKLSGQKFITNSDLRGKVSITVEGPVSTESAYALLSSALADNGYAISRQGDISVVMRARDVQRSLIETVTELPPLQPERMVTWIITVKGIPVEEVNKQLLRTMPSKNGEMTPFPRTNQLIINDFVSNLHRIKRLLDELESGASKNAADAGGSDKPAKAKKK
jgi:general secretion pathway protein D